MPKGWTNRYRKSSRTGGHKARQPVKRLPQGPLPTQNRTFLAVARFTRHVVPGTGQEGRANRQRQVRHSLSATPNPVAPLEDSIRIAYLLTAMALATATAGAEDLEAWLNQFSQKVQANFFVQRF